MKRGDLILLALFLGCQPTYESGKTLCYVEGECPGGFICSDDGAGSAHTCLTMPKQCGNGSAFYCAASGTCWDKAVACSTVLNCGTSAVPDYAACATAGYSPDCSGTTCLPGSGGKGGAVGTGGASGGSIGTSTHADAGGLACSDPAYPVYCGATATIPAGCWGSGTVCSTITNCGTSAAPIYEG